MAEIVVLITAGSEEEAQRLARAVVGEGVAACVNIIPRVRSVFRWEGQIADEQEHLLVVKTIEEAYERLERTIQTLHSYQVPEIIALPIHRGSSAYLTWIRDSIQGKNRE